MCQVRGLGSPNFGFWFGSEVCQVLQIWISVWE